MPLAIYTALESDVQVALSFALVLAGASVMLLLLLRFLVGGRGGGLGYERGRGDAR